jgi:hypothetical protein
MSTQSLGIKQLHLLVLGYFILDGFAAPLNIFISTFNRVAITNHFSNTAKSTVASSTDKMLFSR